MPKKITSFSPIPPEALKKALEDNSGMNDIEVINVHGLPEEEIIEKIPGTFIIYGDHTRGTPITRNIAMAARGAKLVQQPSVGYDSIDVEACKEAGIKVANAAGANHIAVAEHTIMFALNLLKKLKELNEKTHEGQWLQQVGHTDVFELYQKTYGIIGLGQIGKTTAERLVPFGVKTYYFDIKRPSENDEKRLNVSFLELDELLKVSDIVSLHVPLDESTKNMIGERELGLMKETAILINVARGGVVDEKALAKALKENSIAGAGLDVFSVEPISSDNEILGLENAILTPHTAGVTKEAIPRYGQITIANIIRVLKGQEPENVVNE
ncbi:MAG: 2-hydroxyacid dehydrogenase [Deltaproteobacteria bacterium]|nr:2-hydroxyacid dehydrogenase [Deltaproteobacteria bacterium]MBW2050742.1 2-hydroxyacid dehydrogenase [Deltaproteobacteria bacterium]MBW2142052.1 2-hydroxyacid dehydrogenase [Deltaproteobacteria bacterium]